MASQMTVGKKLALGFAVPLLMIAGITVGIFVVANQVKSNATMARDESAVFAGVARQMKLDVVQVQQWLTDISATRGLDGLNDGFDEAEISAKSFQAGLEQFVAMFREENDQEALTEIQALGTAFASYYETGKTMAQGYIDGGPEVGNKLMATVDEAAEQLAGQLDPFVELS